MRVKIPVSTAKKISKETGYPIVIVIGIDTEMGGSIATYGNTKSLCKIAGEIGQNKLGELIFGDDSILLDVGLHERNEE